MSTDVDAELHIDPERARIWDGRDPTGLYIRARHSDGRWDSVDIVVLTSESLLKWLRSRGGDNPWAEDVVGILLQHGHLHA